jgi:antitoxin (DNA-binding transcriptional repressor) of toxin-antitoxin stability system
MKKYFKKITLAASRGADYLQPMLAQLEQIEDTEVKTHLDELLGKVAQGSSFTITKRHQAVARIVPVPTAAPRRRVLLPEFERHMQQPYQGSLNDDLDAIRGET